MEDKEEYNRKGPTRPPSSKPTKEPPKVKARRQSQVDLATFRVSVLKPYGGDLFSQRDHTQGLIYLSRQNLRGGAGAGGKVQAHELVSARGISCLASVARVTAKLDPATTNPEVIMSL